VFGVPDGTGGGVGRVRHARVRRRRGRAWAIGDFDALQETAFLLRVPTDARRLLESLLEAGDGDVEECGLVR